MSKKKLMVLALTAVMVLSVAIGTFATGTQLSFSGSCKKCFLSSDYISKSDSENWSLFCVKLNSITGAETAQARPETSDGKTCGTRFTIEPISVKPQGTKFTPNNRGTTTNEIHVKLYTNEYAEGGVSAATSITVSGTMTGTK